MSNLNTSNLISEEMRLIFNISKTLYEVIEANEKKINKETPSNKKKANRKLKDQLSDFLISLYLNSNMTDSVLVSALVYIDRAVNQKCLFVTRSNLKSLLIGSLIVSMKYNLDFYNISKFRILSNLNPKEMATYEIEFLELIDYRLYIDQDLLRQYSKYLTQ